MPDSKSYTVGFYTFGLANDFEGTIADLLQTWIDAGSAPVVARATSKFEVRRLQRVGNLFKGFIGKLRFDDLPHATRPGGNERELELEDDEGLIEKNFFLYFSQQGVFVYQHQANGATYTQFEQYLTETMGNTISLNPIIQPDAMRRLMRGEVKPRMVELTISKPAANFLGESRLTREMVALMNSSEGMRMHMKFSLGPGRHGPLQALTNAFKSATAELMDHGIVTTAKFHVSEDGDTHPIDLLADRIVGSATVNLVGRYPREADIFHALDESWRVKMPLILESIGQGENALV